MKKTHTTSWAWLLLVLVAPLATWAATTVEGTDGTHGTAAGKPLLDKDTNKLFCSQSARGPVVTLPGATLTLNACSTSTVSTTDICTNTAGGCPVIGSDGTLSTPLSGSALPPPYYVVDGPIRITGTATVTKTASQTSTGTATATASATGTGTGVGTGTSTGTGTWTGTASQTYSGSGTQTVTVTVTGEGTSTMTEPQAVIGPPGTTAVVDAPLTLKPLGTGDVVVAAPEAGGSATAFLRSGLWGIALESHAGLRLDGAYLPAYLQGSVAEMKGITQYGQDLLQIIGPDSVGHSFVQFFNTASPSEPFIQFCSNCNGSHFYRSTSLELASGAGDVSLRSSTGNIVFKNGLGTGTITVIPATSGSFVITTSGSATMQLPLQPSGGIVYVKQSGTVTSTSTDTSTGTITGIALNTNVPGGVPTLGTDTKLSTSIIPEQYAAVTCSTGMVCAGRTATGANTATASGTGTFYETATSPVTLVSSYTLPVAGTSTTTGTSTATLGGVKVGPGLTEAADGTISPTFGTTAGTLAAGDDSRFNDVDRAGVYFLDGPASDIGGYQYMLTTPSTFVDSTTSISVASGDGEKLMAAFVTPIGVPNRALLEGGTLWEYNMVANVSAGVAVLRIYAYTRDLSGTETALFDISSSVISHTTNGTVVDFRHAHASDTTLSTTDRLVVKVFAITTSGTPVTVSFNPRTTSTGSLVYAKFYTPLTVGTYSTRALPVCLSGTVLTNIGGTPSCVTNGTGTGIGCSGTCSAPTWAVFADSTHITNAPFTPASNATTIATSNGLQGGGDLSANRTLSPVYGSSANTVMQGNDRSWADAAGTAASYFNTRVSGTAGYVPYFVSANAIGDLAPYATTPTANAVPVSDSSGSLSSWVTSGGMNIFNAGDPMPSFNTTSTSASWQTLYTYSWGLGYARTIVVNASATVSAGSSTSVNSCSIALYYDDGLITGTTRTVTIQANSYDPTVNSLATTAKVSMPSGAHTIKVELYSPTSTGCTVYSATGSVTFVVL